MCFFILVTSELRLKLICELNWKYFILFESELPVRYYLNLVKIMMPGNQRRRLLNNQELLNEYSYNWDMQLMSQLEETLKVHLKNRYSAFLSRRT